MHDGSADRVNGFDPPHRAPRDGDAGHRRKNKYQSDASEKGRFDLVRELIEIVDLFSDQQMTAVRERIECRSQHRRVHRIRLPLHATHRPEAAFGILLRHRFCSNDVMANALH